MPPAALIAAPAEEFRGRFALMSSFGEDLAVLLPLVAQADPSLPVLFLDPGTLSADTLHYRDGWNAGSACGRCALSVLILWKPDAGGIADGARRLREHAEAAFGRG